MMNVFISKANVESSIEYFKNSAFSADDSLFLFLLSKHFGISFSSPVTYGGALSPTQKAECLNAIWMIGGIFDSSEKCGKRGIIFPTGFSRSELYQPRTEFSNVVGRVRDTIKQKNITVPIYNNTEAILTLKSNYRELIEENYLKGNKISLSHLAAWLFRFTSFEFASMPSENQFTRVIEKVIRKYFKITKNDLTWLFENDLHTNRLTPNSRGITGDELRGFFTFEGGQHPEATPVENPAEAQTKSIPLDTVSRYLELNGDNPSGSDILNILQTKKQIVLTGVPGVGKSRYSNLLRNDPFFTSSKIIQFHASYSYEDFIGSEILRTEGNGTTIDTRRGAFLSFVNDATNDPTHNYLLIIDELNRGNIAEIFGETILALDRNYTVKLSKSYEGVSELKIPDNLYIVGTMNTSDRNIAFLDLAIRRRFAFVSLYPNYDFLSEEVRLDGIDLGNVLRIINQRILDVLKASELILGQSYFIPAKTGATYAWDFNQFKNQFNFVLLPTLKEYSFNVPSIVNTIVGESLADSIQETDEFESAFKAEFAM